MKEFKSSRGMYTLKVTDNLIEMSHKMKGLFSIKRADISEVILKRSPYDFPVLEQTVLIRLNSGKKKKFNMLKKKDAQELYALLSQ